jgi:hypothetical protein
MPKEISGDLPLLMPDADSQYPKSEPNNGDYPDGTTDD